MTGPGLLLCDDLIFSSKVTGTASAHGLRVAVRKTPAALLAAAAETPPACVLLDLQTPGLDVAAVLRTAKDARVIGFGSHVDASTLAAARDAGCWEVLPRSRFVKELEVKLPEWFEQPGVG